VIVAGDRTEDAADVRLSSLLGEGVSRKVGDPTLVDGTLDPASQHRSPSSDRRRTILCGSSVGTQFSGPGAGSILNRTPLIKDDFEDARYRHLCRMQSCEPSGHRPWIAERLDAGGAPLFGEPVADVGEHIVHLLADRR
jgi:hypothetical protein